MFRQFTAMIWLRSEIIKANKATGLQIFLPILMVALYQFMLKDMPQQEKGLFILFTVLPMAYGFVGSLVSLVIAEEQEKSNLRSLQLAGLASGPYLSANLVLPLAIQVVYILVLPLYLGISFSQLGYQYFLVNSLLAVIMTLLYLLVGLLCDSQTKASISSLPIMLGVAFLPTFALMDKGLEKVARYTFMGLFIDYQKKLADFSLFDKSVWIALLWLGVLLVLIAVVLKRSKLRK